MGVSKLAELIMIFALDFVHRWMIEMNIIQSLTIYGILLECVQYTIQHTWYSTVHRVLYCIVQYNTIQYNTNAIQYNTIQYNTVQTLSF